jgi:low affinity Fe/Cu permease
LPVVAVVVAVVVVIVVAMDVVFVVDVVIVDVDGVVDADVDGVVVVAQDESSNAVTIKKLKPNQIYLFFNFLLLLINQQHILR